MLTTKGPGSPKDLNVLISSNCLVSTMLSKLWPKLVAASLALIICVAVVAAWRADRRDRAQLATELAATKQLLAAADARQRDRDAQLAQTLSALASQERSIVTPAQILRALPKTLPLPQPITLQQASSASVGASPGSPAANPRAAATGGASLPPTNGSSTASGAQAASQSTQTPPAGAVIPDADLKPLYDFTLDCQACQAKLLAAQNNLADEKTKTTALTKERDDAVRIVKGGTALRRITRAAKWFLLGAAAGAIASKTTR